MADELLVSLMGGDPSEAFEAVRQAVTAEGIDPFDRDAWLMLRPVIELVRQARPEAGLGDAIDETVAFLHLGYLYWAAGGQRREVGERELRMALEGGTPPLRLSAPPPPYYVSMPARLLWATPTASPAEPLSGWFAARSGDHLRVVAVFGHHPGRDGFTAVAVEGPRPGPLAREDGSPLFSSTLPGGEAAGLHSLASLDELLELAWRVEEGVAS